MDHRYWWMQVGDHVFWITVPKTGPVKVTIHRNTDASVLPIGKLIKRRAKR
jgi:hypothetical protein